MTCRHYDPLCDKPLGPQTLFNKLNSNLSLIIPERLLS